MAIKRRGGEDKGYDGEARLKIPIGAREFIPGRGTDLTAVSESGGQILRKKIASHTEASKNNFKRLFRTIACSG